MEIILTASERQEAEIRYLLERLVELADAAGKRGLRDRAFRTLLALTQGAVELEKS